MNRTAMKVLVAEDDSHTRKGLIDILSGEGYHVVAACDGEEALELYGPHEVFSWLNMTLAHNYRAAFSFLSDAGGWQRWFFTVLASGVSLALLVWLLRLPREERLTGLGLSLILGGAIGNLIDRVQLGYVVDFVDVHYKGWHYPAFNVADSAITCGVILLLLDVVLISRKKAKAN